uniref:sigma factor-like helix-turn-helix DNA-binding protein n=1 Tax=Paractinoplanes polyasparticus TaxID=2856853 RepID=UPI001C845CA7
MAHRLDDERELERVTAALERLRPPDRDVLVLCVWQGLSYAEATGRTSSSGRRSAATLAWAAWASKASRPAPGPPRSGRS